MRHSVRVLGRMGEFEGEGAPFCRKQRPNGRPKAVSVMNIKGSKSRPARARGLKQGRTENRRCNRAFQL